MSAVLDVESVVEFATPLEALANLTTDAVTRLHDPLAACRSPAIQALNNMLHTMLLVELTRERVYDIVLCRKSLLRVARLAIIAAYIVWYGHLSTLRCQ